MRANDAPAARAVNDVRHYRVVLSSAVSAFAIDQGAKWLVVRSLSPGESRDVVSGLISWTFVENRRGAYGLFGDHSWLLALMAICVLVVFAYTFRDHVASSKVAQIAYGMIVSGAVGNIVDRLHYGFVIDFISVRTLPIFEVFNVADMCVSLGVVLLIGLSWVAASTHQSRHDPRRREGGNDRCETHCDPGDGARQLAFEDGLTRADAMRDGTEGETVRTAAAR